MSGINAINIHSTNMFESMIDPKSGQVLVNPRAGNVLNGLFELIGVFLTPFLSKSKKCSPRKIIVVGFYIMSLSMSLNGLFVYLGF